MDIFKLAERYRETGSCAIEYHKKVFKSITSVFTGPDVPKVQQAPIREPDPLPPPPGRSDAETAALADENRKQNTPRRPGRASSFLTQSGTTAASSAVRFLGGSQST